MVIEITKRVGGVNIWIGINLSFGLPSSITTQNTAKYYINNSAIFDKHCVINIYNIVIFLLIIYNATEKIDYNKIKLFTHEYIVLFRTKSILKE